MPCLTVRSLACRRGGRLVFDELGFELTEGCALLLTGRNGAGKSTLLRALALLTPVTHGTIAWDGGDVRDDPDAWQARLAWLGHADAIKGDLTVRETLEAAHRLRLGAVPAPRAWDEAVACFDVAPLLGRPGRHLSAGQRRRVALTRVLLSAAPLWLLDEPASGLDEASRQALHTALGGHLASAGLAVIATHGDIALPGAATLDVGTFAASAASQAAAWT